jgi:peptidoglycan/LPS O-acetylase OafA/YrhL
MLVALQIRHTEGGHIPRGWELLDLAGLICLYLLACYFLYGPLNGYPYPTKDLLNACLWCPILLIACSGGTLVDRAISNRVLVWLGVRSYSIYLIHLPLIFALGGLIARNNLGQPAAFLTLCGVGLPLTLAAAAVFFEIFERPFLNAPREQIQAGEVRRRQGAAPRGQEARITSPQAW